MRRRRRGIAIAVAAAALAASATAWATFPSVNVNHDPPLLSIDDTNPVTHVNDLTVRFDGSEILIAEATFPPFTDDEECMDEDGNSLTLHCDPAGIERLEISLRAGDDRLDWLNLGPLASMITQIVRGGWGDDVLLSRTGPQRLIGGTGEDRLEAGRGDDVVKGKGSDDYLIGGAGDDVLDGGPGEDRCVGFHGDDVKINCE